MLSCLGLYIEDNLIKYAKISREKNTVKIDAYGMKFFDNLDSTIQQIVRETYSYNTPISVNVKNENYAYADVFSLLNSADLKKAIDTEFDCFCNEKSKNRKALEYRYITMPNKDDRDKTRAVYTYVDKASIIERLQSLSGYKVKTVTATPTAIANLFRQRGDGNAIIVNIEDKTTVTTIVDDKVYKVDTIDLGMSKIIKNIAERENSASKAYEICKNTTIYTTAGKNLQLENNDYLEEIMPTLYNIIEKIKDIMIENNTQINSIYITGTGAMVNNIDLYFQENFMDKKCEILIPFFIERTNIKVNIKDYIEVNSAIALALEGIKTGKETVINFTKQNDTFERLKEVLTMDVGSKSKAPKAKKEKIPFKERFKHDIKLDLDWIEAGTTRAIATLAMFLIIYIGIVHIIRIETNKKIAQAQDVITDTQSKIDKVEEYKTLINNRTDQYENLLAQIEENNEKVAEAYASRNAIPNLLNKVMFAVPDKVQILLIENTSGKTIKIIAESEEYKQLGYFKAAIQNDTILVNVTSSSGVYSNGVITVEITGELPY